jgi:hypothetical protein
LIGFEVNTDFEFIDPDWEVFAELHDRRYGLAISYVKSIVKGTTFDNQVMNLRIGESGFYVQSKNFPASFYGDTGLSELAFLSNAEAQALVFDAVALYRAGDARSITCVYSDSTPADVFFGYRFTETERYELGMMRANLPLHLRVMIDSEEENELLGDKQGVLIYQRTGDGRHLVIKAPGRRQPFPLLDGFNE